MHTNGNTYVKILISVYQMDLFAPIWTCMYGQLFVQLCDSSFVHTNGNSILTVT